MRVIPRHELPFWLHEAGLEAPDHTFSDPCAVHRLTIREAAPPVFSGGPHRSLSAWDADTPTRSPIADRPALSDFIAALFIVLPVTETLATVAEGSFWLNNRAQSRYLRDVPDAQAVARFLRQRGLTDRFRGGFRVARPQFSAVLPRLAANTYAGGAAVRFATLHAPNCRFTALACPHYDIHLTTLQPCWLDLAADLARQRGLEVERLELPDLAELWPELPPLWPEVVREENALLAA